MRLFSVLHLARMVRINVNGRLSTRPGGGQSGAVTMVVAIFMGTGVFLGCAAITIDAGSLLTERRQLQNGADAAALSIAKSCIDAARVSALCAAPDIGPSSALVALAGANADDQRSDIASVCGSVALHAVNPAAFPTTCATSANPALVECPSTSSGAQYVEVRTSTRSGTGSSNILPPILAQALAGGSYTGETVKACSRVAWGNAGASGPVIFPVAFSYCDWLSLTGALPLQIPIVLGKYQPPPAAGLVPGYGYNSPPNTQWPGLLSEATIYSQSLLPSVCLTWNGHVAPGNFASLENVGCSATVVDGWVQGDTGNSVPCDATILGAEKGQVVYIPIFDCDTPTWNVLSNCNNAHGSHDWYHISGYAAFYLTGFYFSSAGNDGRSIYPPDNGAKPCGGSNRCVSGWFTTGTLQNTIDTSGAPGFGSYAMQSAG